ncbi:hypothetical protein [Amycolatopsis cihanbeyliensis]|uniref:hypothetical protein n=1 Tax=Amycolatopsis cihanbeyliensis TaxID=1128664 RepID=UPI00114FD331|nr:hypothetical protein [Amycolatopsis cihanbeyliensis]
MTRSGSAVAPVAGVGQGRWTSPRACAVAMAAPPSPEPTSPLDHGMDHVAETVDGQLAAPAPSC